MFLLVQSKALDEAPYKLFGVVAKLAGITFWSLAFFYWIDIPWFHNWGKTCCCAHHTFSWGSQLVGYLHHQHRATKELMAKYHTTTSGVIACIERYAAKDPDLCKALTAEMRIFRNAEGDFGRVTAINDRHFMLPSMSLHFLLQLYFLFYIL
jgi:hypothetical protein